MNLDSSIFALTQIDILVRNLKSENLDSVWSVISELIRVYGSLAERQFLYSLISLVVVQQEENPSKHSTTTNNTNNLSAEGAGGGIGTLSQSQTTSSSSVSASATPTTATSTGAGTPTSGFITAARKLLSTKYTIDFTRPIVITSLSSALEASGQPAEYFLNRFITVLNLSSVERVVCAVALQTHATILTLYVDEKVAALIREILTQDLPTSQIQQTLLQNISQLHVILQYLHQHPEGLSVGERNQFIERIASAFTEQGYCPKILLPYLTKYSSPGGGSQLTEEMESEVGGNVNNAQSVNMTFDPGVVEFVLEHGIGICATVEECRATLMTVGTNKINPATVARIIHGMLKAQDILNLQNQNSQQHQNIWGTLRHFQPAPIKTSQEETPREDPCGMGRCSCRLY